MKKLLFITYILLFALYSCSDAPDERKNPDYAPMSIASDLSNQRITAFAEDSSGHIWIGTFRGLNRYNAHDYHQYVCTDSIIDLPDNQINDLFRDSRNRLWVATIGGVAIYDKNHHFHRVNNENKAAVPNAYQITESRDKQVYVNYKHRLDVYDEEAGALRTVIPNLNPENAYSVSCHFDRRNKLWVVKPNSLTCYQLDPFERIDSVALPAYVSSHYMDTDNDCIWLGGDRYLAVYDLRNHKMRELPHALASDPNIAKANIINIHPYEGGYWLLNTSNLGLLLYNSITDRVWQENEPGFPFDLPNFRIMNFFTDSHKNLWVGSYDHGCAVINKYQRQFNSLAPLQTFVNGRAVHAVDADHESNLWMATGFDGVLVYNTQTGEANSIDPHIFSGANAPNASITVVEATKDGSIWLGSLLEHKLWKCKWSGGNLKIIKEYAVPTPLALAEDAQGNLWVGTGGPWLMRYNAATDSFDGVEMPSEPIPDCFVPAVAPAPDNLYVAALVRPLMQAQWQDNAIKLDSISVSGWENAITRSFLIPTDLLYDSYGLLWLGTVGNGLLLYDPEKKSISRVPGLPCTDISAIEEDKQGHIWVSTQYGLARYDRTTGRIKCYYAIDGIGGNQFYDRASTILPDGTLAFGGTHGITTFNPIDIGYKRKVPLVFEELKIHNTIVDPLEHPDILPVGIENCPQVTLNSDENAFSISFSALDYASAEPPSYSYRLEGHDPYWIDARQNNEAYYAKLKPGDYTFKVRIADGSNSLMEEEIALPIHIRGSLWLFWWAIAIYAAIIALIALVIIKHRRDIRHHQEQMRQMLLTMEQLSRSGTEQASEPQPSQAQAGYRQSRFASQRTLPSLASSAEEVSKATVVGGFPPTEASESQLSQAKATVVGGFPPTPAAVAEAATKLSDSDTKFLQELNTLMERELSDPELDINRLTEMMRISRTKLYYKIKSLTGVNPSVFFKTYKLNRAAQLLREGRHTIAEIAEMTGFSTPAHFSTSFKNQFGKTPSEYAK